MTRMTYIDRAGRAHAVMVTAQNHATDMAGATFTAAPAAVAPTPRLERFS